MKIESLSDLPHTKAYISRIGAEPRSLFKAVVREETGTGYWRDICIIRFDKKGDVSAPIGYEPDATELEKIKLEFSSIDWPEGEFIDPRDPKMPKMVTEADPKNVFWFKNEDGKIVMVQVRFDKRDGKKAYVPITKWSDGEFRFLEPEGALPLYGLENIRKHSTVLIVEGAKCARYVQWLSDGATPEARKAREDHPWGDSLTNICVLGWCAGALSPSRCDWSPIQRAGITRAYVALDHDQVGREALPTISKALRCVTHSIEFTDEFAVSADLYDPFPEKFFREINGKRYYIGPSFKECCHPSTWMTDVIQNPEDPKKKAFVLRHNARGLWHYIEESEVFCYIENPEIIRKADSLDSMLRPFSDAKKTSELILAGFNGRITNFDYSPAHTERKIMVNGKPTINLYMPSNVKPKHGDTTPWLDFVAQLIPDEKERHLVLRWIATLSAKPAVRMIYALLLVSEETGTGKSTLGRICQELVGTHNASTPSEQAVMGDYNSWLVRKRAIVLQECYSGHSWKMFTKLKELITEPTVSMRMMYKDPVDISNWGHFLLFSNSMSALKIDAKDRRIFAPRVTETRWPDEKWKEFHSWLASGGFQIIAQWALDFGDYVTPGERAPMTANKQEMIESSRSKASVRVEELAELAKTNRPIALADKEIFAWLEAITKERVFETLLDIRKSMKRYGLFEAKDFGVDRFSYNSQMSNFILNEAAKNQLLTIDEAEKVNYVRSAAKKPSELMTFEGERNV